MSASGGNVRARRRPALLRESAASDGLLTRRHKADYWLIVIAALLLTIGLIVVYSISPGLSESRGVSSGYYISRQLIAVGLGIVAFVVTSQIPISWWKKLTKPLIVIALIGCLVAAVTPLDSIYQAHRWIRFGGLSFQVAELIKLAILVGVATFLTTQWRLGKLGDTKATLRPLLIILAAVAVIVVFFQRDLGSAAVMVAMIAAMAFVVGIPLKKVMLIGGVILIGLTLAIASTPYRRDRLLTYLHPERDCQAAGYQACQALIAVGSGGVIGLGLGGSVQAYGYLPEAGNDSIFAILAEKFGFLGVSMIVALYVVLFTRLKRIIERLNDQFSRLFVVGFLAWVSTQAIINIGAMVGLLPLKGITLPFISYGGTSLLFLMIGLGIVFQISRYTTYSYAEPKVARADQPNHDNAQRRRVGGAYNPNIVSRPRN